MAIIYSYPLNLNILDTDVIIGTSTRLVNGRPKNQTKSFKIEDLANYFIPTLNQVLQVGNVSQLDAKIGELYLYDDPVGSYAKMSVSDNVFMLDSAGGVTILTIDNGNNLVLNNGTATAQILNPLTTNRTYTLPDKSGTFALTSDTPTNIPTLQQVVNVGNAIVVPTTVAKGIDITLANQSTVYQNGILVTIPLQTTVGPGIEGAPDAFKAVLNGQSPDSNGSPFGFVTNMTGADNVGFVAEMETGSLFSRGFVARSKDNATGYLFSGDKITGGITSNIFNITHDGNIAGKSFIKTGGTSAQFLKADGSTSTMPTLQEVTTAGHITNNDISVNSLFLYDNANDGDGNISFNDNIFRVQGLGNPNYFFTVDNGQVLSLHNGMAYANIINNLTTARDYTLPNASGTFALTSDLTNLVTTNTVQTITGTKTFNGGLIFDAEQAVIDMRNQYDTGASINITLYDTATDPEGLRVNNNNNNGTAISITNSLSGYGFYGNNSSNGILMTLAASASSTGDLLRCFKNSVITTKVDTNGNITAPSFVKTGGTSDQILLADGSTSSLAAKADKSMSAYSVRVNNTASTANETEVTYRAPGQQVYTGTITWTGTTAPIGATNHSYNWIQIGNQVTLTINLLYSVVGVSLTAVQMNLPLDCPAPINPTGYGLVGNDNIYIGSGILNNSVGGLSSAVGRTVMRRNSANTANVINITMGGGGYASALSTIQYFTS